MKVELIKIEFDSLSKTNKKTFKVETTTLPVNIILNNVEIDENNFFERLEELNLFQDSQNKIEIIHDEIGLKKKFNYMIIDKQPSPYWRIHQVLNKLSTTSPDDIILFTDDMDILFNLSKTKVFVHPYNLIKDKIDYYNDDIKKRFTGEHLNQLIQQCGLHLCNRTKEVCDYLDDIEYIPNTVVFNHIDKKWDYNNSLPISFYLTNKAKNLNFKALYSYFKSMLHEFFYDFNNYLMKSVLDYPPIPIDFNTIKKYDKVNNIHNKGQSIYPFLMNCTQSDVKKFIRKWHNMPSNSYTSINIGNKQLIVHNKGSIDLNYIMVIKIINTNLIYEQMKLSYHHDYLPLPNNHEYSEIDIENDFPEFYQFLKYAQNKQNIYQFTIPNERNQQIVFQVKSGIAIPIGLIN